METSVKPIVLMNLVSISCCFTLLGTTVAHGAPATATPKSAQSPAGAIACDEDHALLVKPDGKVFAWGGNDHGQLGDGTVVDSATGVTVANVIGITAVAANHSFSMALRDDGTVWTWGSNEWGQLGDGTYDSRPVPAQVSGLGGIVAISAGSMHALALKNDGTVWTWGSNDNFRLGDGTAIDRVTPRSVPGLTAIVAIAAGELNNAGVSRDGSIWRWGVIPGLDRGAETAGALDPRRTRSKHGMSGASARMKEGDHMPGVPSRIFELAGARSVAVGLHNLLVLKNDGTIWIAGENDVGQLGDETKNANWTSLAQVTGLTGVVAIAARSENLLALQADGTAWEWGSSAGLSVISGAFESARPQLVPRLVDVVAIATGGDNNFAVRRDGTGAGWGADWADRIAPPTSAANGNGFDRLAPRDGESFAPAKGNRAGGGAAKSPPAAPDLSVTPSRAASRLP